MTGPPPPAAPGERDEASAREAGEAVAAVARVMARLRGEGGCPWDRAQTRETLRGFVIEEAYEAVEALDRGDPARIRDELGDLLFQVVFQARVGEERGEFDLAAVARGLGAKLVRRHPHVFGPDAGRPRSPQEIERLWEDRKRAERAERAATARPHGTEAAEASPAGAPSDRGAGSALDGVPAALPALLRLERLKERAARTGFDWPDAASALSKVDEEQRELRDAVQGGDPAAIAHELGDAIGALVSLGRLLGVSAEDAARAAAERFSARFRRLEALAAERFPGGDFRTIAPEDLDRLWEGARA